MRLSDNKSVNEKGSAARNEPEAIKTKIRNRIAFSIHRFNNAARELKRLHQLEQRVGHFGGSRRHAAASRFESVDFRFRRPFTAADDGARVAHAAARGSSRASDKSGHRLLAMFGYPFGSFFFGRAADFTDHDDAVRLR